MVLGYYTSWSIYGRRYYVWNITADRLTHLSYAFAGIDSSGELNYGDQHADTLALFPGDSDHQPLRGNFNQLQKLKEKHPHLRTLISVGGDVIFSPSSIFPLNSSSLSIGRIRSLSSRGCHSTKPIGLR